MLPLVVVIVQTILSVEWSKKKQQVHNFMHKNDEQNVIETNEEWNERKKNVWLDALFDIV